jgi:hypothetical protein
MNERLKHVTISIMNFISSRHNAILGITFLIDIVLEVWVMEVTLVYR